MPLPPDPFPTRSSPTSDVITQSKEHSPRRAKLHAVLIATILGALLFDGAYLLFVHMKSREGPDVAALLVCIPPQLVRNATGWNSQPGTVESAQAFDLAVNGLLGAFIFSACAAVYQFLKYIGPLPKDDNASPEKLDA